MPTGSQAHGSEGHVSHDGLSNGNGDKQFQHPMESESSPAHGNDPVRPSNALQRVFHRWEQTIDRGIAYYVKALDVVLRNRLKAVALGFSLLALTVAFLWPVLRKEFFPEVDAGAFEMYVRAPSGLRIEKTEQRIAAVEDFVRKTIDEEDLQLILAEIGVTSDWSAAYTPNAGPMDAVVKIQLSPERKKSAQEYVTELRRGFAENSAFSDLEFAFDAGGMVRSAMNEGKSTPISVRVTGKDQKTAHRIASAIRNKVKGIDGVVDARIIQRLDYPQYVIKVDRAKSAQLGLTQADVMKAVIAALQLEHPVQQAQFLDRPQEQEPVLRGGLLLREGYRVDRHPAGHSDHQPGSEPADPDADCGVGGPLPGGDRGDSLQHPADDRADDGRRGSRPGSRVR